MPRSKRSAIKNLFRVLNPNGRKIDYGGIQYNRLIRKGYKLNEKCSQLIQDPQFTGDRNAPLPRGRPKGVPVIKPASSEVFENPLTNRKISKSGATYKALLKNYRYDEHTKKFVTHVKYPKNNANLILINGSYFKEYENKGYVYDQYKNELIKPSKKSAKAFGNVLVTRDLTILNKNDPEDQMNKLNQRISFLLNEHLKKLKGLRFNIGLAIQFTKPDPVSENRISETFYIIGKNAVITHESDISKAIQMQRNQISIGIDRFTNNGSGWVIDEITKHYLNVGDYKPLAAKSYIPLPSCIQNRKATINIKNDDDKCFMYCLGRFLDPNPEKKNLERVSQHLKRVCKDLKLYEIKMPVALTKENLSKIEQQFNISVNVYGLHDDNGIYPIQLSRKENVKHMDLLYIENEVTNHYVLIKDFDKLNLRIDKGNNKKYFCNYCLQHFTTNEIREEHKKNCIIINGTQAVELPKEGTKIKFNNLQNLIACPFVIYADLEALNTIQDG